MLKKVLAVFGIFSSGALAHIKPIEHPHVGFLHLEDILLLGVVVAVGGISLFLFKIAAERIR